MATPRQIAANRRNAQKSTGPKSRAAKQRVRDNALQHGLASARPRDFDSRVEELARQFAEGLTDPIALELARDAAYAQLELVTIKGLNASYVHHAYYFGCTVSPVRANPRRLYELIGSPKEFTEFISPQSTMPPAGPDRLAEAIRRALPETAKLARYYERAAATRNRALQALARLKRGK